MKLEAFVKIQFFTTIGESLVDHLIFPSLLHDSDNITNNFYTDTPFFLYFKFKIECYYQNY